MKSTGAFKSIDEYILAQPADVQATLQKIRQAIREAAPEAIEAISYQMPAFKQDEVLVWFAAFKKHVGFFPKTAAIVEFKDKLVSYKTSKGTIQFPLDKPVPLELIEEIVRFRVKEITAKN